MDPEVRPSVEAVEDRLSSLLEHLELDNDDDDH